MKKWWLAVGVCVARCALAAPILVTSIGGLAPNQSASWGQLGGDGTTLNALFTATTTGSLTVNGSFAGGAGSAISVVCPAAPSCSWIPSGAGLAAGDSLIVTDNGTGGATGPLTLAFPAVFGAGLEMQSDAPGTYTARIAAYNGASLLGTFTEASNANGDPLFIGVLDTSADITKIVIDESACGGLGCSTDDFAVDALQLKAAVSPAPEPSTWAMFAVALAVLFSSGRVRKIMGLAKA